MLKVLGFICLLSGGALWGMEGEKRLKSRETELRELMESAERLSGLVCRAREPLPSALRLAEGNRLHLFSVAAEKIEAGESAHEAFTHAVDIERDCLRLDGEDAECLYRFARGLSAPDVEGQAQNFAVFSADMAERCKAAGEARRQKGKLYRVGGVLLGSRLGLFLW